MIKIRLKIDIDIYNFDEYTCPHICTLLRYNIVEWQVIRNRYYQKYAFVFTTPFLALRV